MKHIYILAASLLVFTACSKHAGDKELPGASITFSKPLPGSIYHTGDTVNIKGIATAEVTMHGYDVSVKKANDTTTYFFTHVHDHNDTLIIDQKWKNTVAASASMEVFVTVYLDHDGHTATKKVGFTSN